MLRLRLMLSPPPLQSLDTTATPTDTEPTGKLLTWPPSLMEVKWRVEAGLEVSRLALNLKLTQLPLTVLSARSNLLTIFHN